MKKRLSSGAEAIIYLEDSTILKDRVKKSYRIEEIDHSLRQFRTRREAKVLQKLADINFPGPRLVEKDDKKMHIRMEYLKGDLLKEVFDRHYQRFSKELGEKVAKLHNNDIIHGDLTTSNMLFYKDEIYFIDFGLSFFSRKYEGKAVDIHLLKQALESKHWKVYKKAFDIFIKHYKKHTEESKEILQRLEEVEKRGRHKTKG